MSNPENENLKTNLIIQRTESSKYLKEFKSIEK